MMSYLNPLLSLGETAMARKLAEAGVDGLLATDLVAEEADQVVAAARAANLDTIFMIAPTSTDARIKRVAEICTGFIYAVSRAGVTGIRDDLSRAASDLVGRARKFTDKPIAVGFGVSTAAHVATVWEHADGAAVGSRIVAEIEKLGSDARLVESVGRLARDLVSH
jgi:tryptophan synthase alpha chain